MYEKPSISKLFGDTGKGKLPFNRNHKEPIWGTGSYLQWPVGCEGRKVQQNRTLKLPKIVGGWLSDKDFIKQYF